MKKLLLLSSMLLCSMSAMHAMDDMAWKRSRSQAGERWDRLASQVGELCGGREGANMRPNNGWSEFAAPAQARFDRFGRDDIPVLRAEPYDSDEEEQGARDGAYARELPGRNYRENRPCNACGCARQCRELPFRADEQPAGAVPATWSTGKTVGVVGLVVVAVGVIYKYGNNAVTTIADFFSSKTAKSSKNKTAQKPEQAKTVVA